MQEFQSLLVAVLICWTNTEGIRNRNKEDQVIPLTPNTLNQATFLKYQRIPLRRLPTRQERRRYTGAPVLICGEGSMGILINYPFNGRIFASHRENDKECVEYITINTIPKFMTPLEGNCGIWSRKSLQPSSTDFHLRVVVSFHYEHLTEEDKIYDLTCTYSSKNISVGAYYDTVNFVAHPLLNASHLPVCHYSLRKDTLDGPRTSSATIGQLVYHRWSCPSNDYAFKVYRCYVHNGYQQSYLIVNDQGCSLDESILPHPTYDLQKGLVYTPSKAFRFTKSRRVHFNCMLSVCHKNDEECMREIPPRCSRKLRKRQLSSSEISVEERLKRIRARMNAMNNFSSDFSFDEMVFEDNEVRSSENVVSRPLLINDEDKFEQQGFSSQSCLPSNYVHWIYALLITNVLSILVAVLACSNLLKKQFAIDIVTIRNKYRCAM